MEDKESVESFLRVARRLSDVEDRYSRFLSAEITVSLMRIQEHTRSLDVYSRLYQKSLLMKKRMPEKTAKLAEIDYDDLVGGTLKDLIEEVYRMDELGVELSYP